MRTKNRRALKLAFAAVLPMAAASAATAATPSNPALPAARMTFEPNLGQAPREVKFLARGAAETLLITDNDMVMTVQDEVAAAQPAQPAVRKTATVRMHLRGAGTPKTSEGLGRQSGVSHYRIGRDESRWVSNVPHFERVKLGGVYPGVDFVAYGKGSDLEYDFVVAPGADPKAIRLEFQGANPQLDQQGDLLLETTAGTLRHAKPIAYQMVNGVRQPVAARMRQMQDGSFGYVLGTYNRRAPLVIDPVVSFSKRLGGSGREFIRDIAVDGSGNVYATGYTNSTNFPVQSAAQSANAGGVDTFVTKYDANGTVVYSTYYGGSGDDEPRAIAVDSTGQAYVVGSTRSGNLPIPRGFQTSPLGDNDSFVAILSASGATITYGTYFGARRAGGHEGTTLDINDVVVNTPSEVFLIGSVFDGDIFDEDVRLNGFQRVKGGNWDAWVMRLSPPATAANQVSVFSFYGGSNDEFAARMGRKTDLSLVVAGSSNSPDLRPPNKQHGPVSRANGIADVFLLGVSRACSYNGAVTIGGSAADVPADIVVDGANHQYVIGTTMSHDYPNSTGIARPNQGLSMFVSRLDGSAVNVKYSTYLDGPAGSSEPHGIAVTSSGVSYVTGWTLDPGFPVTLGAIQPAFPGSGRPMFLSRINAVGTRTYSTFLGTGGNSSGNAIGYRAGSIYLGGEISPQAFPGAPTGSSNDGSLTRFKLSALFIVNSTTLPAGDSAIKTRLQNLGLSVTVKAAGSSATGDAFGKDLVVVSSTVTSGAVAAKFKSVEVPVLVLEQAIQDDMAMTGPTSGTDFGTQASQNKVKMLIAGDPLSGGVPIGDQTVTLANKTFNWGKPAAAAVKVASLVGDSAKITIYRYEAGDIMVNAFKAPERRVGFWIGDDAAASLNGNGGNLFDAAIRWTAGF